VPDDGPVDVLLVGGGADQHVLKVVSQLEQMGARTVRWNLDDLRSTQQVTVPGSLSLWVDDAWAQVVHSTTVWWHRAGGIRADDLDEEERQLAAEEGPILLRGALVGAGVRWVDDPYVIERAETRFAQLGAARSLGIRMPSTVQTNFAGGAAAIRQSGPVVAKAVSPGQGITPFVGILADEEYELLSGNPTFLQELVPASADLRVVTVADRSWIWRRERAQGVIDWRQVDPDGVGFVRVDDSKLAAAATEITAALRLTMGVSDWLETDADPVFLETNPQGGWLFLDGAEELIVPTLAQHLFVPIVAGTAHGNSGTWPKALRRVVWDLGPASKAPPNDGLVAPTYPRPDWIDRVAVIPGAVEAAKNANEAARDAAKTAEAKATRLVQLGLALLALAFAVAAYQLTFDLDRSVAWLPTLIPVGLAIVCLALAVFEAGEIDRVGFYREVQPSDFDGVGPAGAAAVALEVEETGRRLARWTARNKLTDLMQARAWLARGLVALIAAAIVAGVCRGTSASPEPSHPDHGHGANRPSLHHQPRRPTAPTDRATAAVSSGEPRVQASVDR
jgi:hypothetical protein